MLLFVIEEGARLGLLLILGASDISRVVGWFLSSSDGFTNCCLSDIVLRNSPLTISASHYIKREEHKKVINSFA